MGGGCMMGGCVREEEGLRRCRVTGVKARYSGTAAQGPGQELK